MIACLEMMSHPDWMGWAGECLNNPSPPGVAVYDLATLSCQDGSTSVLPHLFSGGLDPNLCYPGGKPLAANINKPVDLQAFMSAGGNLRSTMANENTQARSELFLWEHLRRDGDLRPIIDSWSKCNEPAAISDKLVAEYWSGLGGYVTSQEIGPRAKSHPEWATLEDAQGRNCAMYLLKLHPSCHRFLAMKQCHGLLSKRDRQGHDLWFHALSITQEPRRPTRETFSLLASKSPKSENPVSGRGLLAEVLLDEEFRPGFGCGIDSAADDKRVMKALPARKWLAGSDHDLERLEELLRVSVMGHGDKTKQLSRFNLLGVSKILLAHADDIEHPGLCWAAVLAMAESRLLGRLEPDRLVSLVARSGRTGWVATEKTMLESHVPGQIEVIDTGLFANCLADQTVKASADQGAAPRF